MSGGVGPQQPYSTDPSSHGNKMQIGTPGSSVVSVVLGALACLLVTVTSVEWAAVTCALVAIVAGLSGQVSHVAWVKYTGWAGIALGVVALAIRVSN
jgi:hypothetical protein